MRTEGRGLGKKFGVRKFGENGDKEDQFKKNLEPELRSGALKRLVFQETLAQGEAILVLLEIPE